MAIGTSRKRVVKPAEERRRELLDAALEVFASKSLHEATVSDVTGAAGVAKGTFYLYFDSKEQLLGALKERFVDELVGRAASLYERIGTDDWWTLADETVEEMIDFMLEHRALIEVFAQEGFTPESYRIFAECEAKLVSMFASGIEAGRAAGVFSVEDPETTATLLSHAIDGTIEHTILYEERVDRDRLIAAAKALTRRALAPGGKSG